jgi:hypothetical protein
MEVGLEKRLFTAICNVTVTPTKQSCVGIPHRRNLSLNKLDFAV